MTLADSHMLVTAPCFAAAAHKSPPNMQSYVWGFFESQPSFCVLFRLGMAVISLIEK